MASSRHGRPGTFSIAVIVTLALVVLGTASVAVLADSVLAVRLAVAGALAAALLVGTTYDAVLRAARADAAHQHALEARVAGELSALRITNERALRSLQETVDALRTQGDADVAADVAVDVEADRDDDSGAGVDLDTSTEPDLWDPTSDAPTVVRLANRRAAREVADESSRAAQRKRPARSTGTV